MSYKKVLSKATFLTIACFFIATGIYAERNMEVDMSSAYFYKDSYEGFAGYCTIVTPEITAASAKMQKRLNIISQKQIINTGYNNKENPYKNVRNKKHRKTQTGISFSSVIIAAANAHKKEKQEPSKTSLILTSLSQN